ncbi:hypothetical protein TRVA0_006S01046 [Trichomonascus vanleenenianus]|uniref:HAT repeat-containing protein n=1 Tax=Trichomonascus vanleenenianus TaxID=2268995 RepID=UPI003ECACD18
MDAALSAYHEAYEAVQADDDNLDTWERLSVAIDAVVPYVGSVDKRTLSLESIESIYIRFLSKFPLLHGYWLKFVEVMKSLSHGDKDKVKSVYENAVSSFPNSVDLWVAYSESEESPETRQQLLIRACEKCGLDFMGHPVWDARLEVERALNGDVKPIFETIIRIPLHQYARYFEEYSSMLSEEEKADSNEVFASTQAKTSERWAYEAHIARNYFHVHELEADEIDNWNSYLDYIEEVGTPAEVRALYERALVPAALYDSFWLRYIRWMIRNGEDEEEIRNGFRRASTVFVPIARPLIRYQWAIYEESVGQFARAKDVYDIIHQSMQSSLFEDHDWYVQRLNLELRTGGVKAVADLIATILSAGPQQQQQQPKKKKKAATAANTQNNTVAYAVCNTYQAVAILYKVEHMLKKALELLESLWESCNWNRYYVTNYFWLMLAASNNDDGLHVLWERIVSEAPIPPLLIEDLSNLYMDHLKVHSTSPEAVKRLMQVDIETNGCFPLRKLSHKKYEDDVEHRLTLENGHPGIVVDPSERYTKASAKTGLSPVLERYLQEQKRYLK